MNIERIDLNLLKVFHAIAQEQQLSKAGQRLGLTQPAMSHALRRLRDLFEDKLFIRTPRGMKPTEHALILIEPISRALNELQNNLSDCSEFDPLTAKNTFRIGVNDYGSVIVLPKIIRAVRQLAPKIILQATHITSVDNYHALDMGQIDLAIMTQSDCDARFNQQILYTESAVCVVCKNNSQVSKVMDMQTYLQLDHVAVSPKLGESSWIDTTLNAQNLQRRIAVTVPHFNAAPASIINTNLISTLPLRVASIAAEQYPSLKLLPLPFEAQTHPIAQLWHRRDENNVAHSWFRGVVEDCIIKD